jgi:type I site-specific restriction-modification system R (restriction) subunit
MSNDFGNLCFPEHEFKLKKENAQTLIFDELRTKWIICTPEEWVRQNLIKFLITDLKYPKNLISIEKGLNFAGRKYRFDALLFDKNFMPLMLIECKAPNVKLNQKVFDQIWNYNYEISSPFFLVTNGIGFIAGKCSIKSGVVFFKQMPSFDELINMK